MKRLFQLAVFTVSILHASADVDFTKVQTVLEQRCVGCHRVDNALGGLRLDDREQALKGGAKGPAIQPGNSAGSLLAIVLTLPDDNPLHMPPKAQTDEPLSNAEIQLLKEWIDGGARWPEGVKLTAKKKRGAFPYDTRELVEKIHTRIVAQAGKEAAVEIKAYTTAIPGHDVTYSMVAIPGGRFLMGSPEAEQGRVDDEGPQKEVEIAPFWMGKYEVSWDEFELFADLPEERKLREAKNLPAEVNHLSDATSHPTRPYTDMSFGMGKKGFPADCITQHAANKYCQWLSAKTGHFYRLPTEAEWEYAARAGTKTAYFWGDDPKQASEYCWWGKNSDFRYQKVGKKKPNPWGLHDILGNVLEWTLDQYDENSYASLASVNPWTKATKPYPHSVRGGSFDDDEAEKLRCAARRGSEHEWKVQDPQLPQSVWWHTEARWVGFRIVRPVKIPTADEMFQYWNSGVEYDIPGYKPGE